MSCWLFATLHSQFHLVLVLAPAVSRIAEHFPFPHRSVPSDSEHFSIERELPHEFADIPRSW